MGVTPLTDMTIRGAKNKWSNSQIVRGLSEFLAVQDASFYTVGKIARKNLATGSRIFSCYPSGHIDSRKLVCYL